MRRLEGKPVIEVPAADFLGRAVSAYPEFWIRLGNLESGLLPLAEPAIHAPIYVCGLARAGSTMLLETLAAQPEAVRA